MRLSGPRLGSSLSNSRCLVTDVNMSVIPLWKDILVVCVVALILLPVACWGARRGSKETRRRVLPRRPEADVPGARDGWI